MPQAGKSEECVFSFDGGQYITFSEGAHNIDRCCIWKNTSLNRYYNKLWITAIWGGKRHFGDYDGYVSFCDTDGNRVSSLDFHLIDNANEDYEPVCVGEADYSEYGFTYIDKNFNLLTQPKYAMAKPFHNGFAKVRPDSSKKHILMINKEGREIYTHDRYVKVGKFSEGLCADSQGRPLLNGWYKNMCTMYRYPDYFTVERAEPDGTIRHELIQRDGAVIFSSSRNITALFWVTAYRPDLKEAVFKEHEKCGLVSFGNEVLLPAEYERIWPRTFGTYLVKQIDKYGLLDADRNIIMPLIYDQLHLDDEGVLILHQGSDSIVCRLTPAKPKHLTEQEPV